MNCSTKKKSIDVESSCTSYSKVLEQRKYYNKAMHQNIHRYINSSKQEWKSLKEVNRKIENEKRNRHKLFFIQEYQDTNL